MSSGGALEIEGLPVYLRASVGGHEESCATSRLTESVLGRKELNSSMD